MPQHLDKILAARSAAQPVSAVGKLIALSAGEQPDEAAQASYMVLAALEDLDSLRELLLAYGGDSGEDDDADDDGDADSDDDDEDDKPKKKGKKPPFGKKGSSQQVKAAASDDEDEDDDHAGHATYKALVKKGVPPAKAAAMCARADNKVKATALCADAISALSELYVPLSVLTAAERRKPSAHTIPGSTDYPIPDEGHLSAAVARYKEGKFAGHSQEEVRRHILSSAKRLGKQVDLG